MSAGAGNLVALGRRRACVATKTDQKERSIMSDKNRENDTDDENGTTRSKSDEAPQHPLHAQFEAAGERAAAVIARAPGTALSEYEQGVVDGAEQMKLYFLDEGENSIVEHVSTAEIDGYERGAVHTAIVDHEVRRSRLTDAERSAASLQRAEAALSDHAKWIQKPGQDLVRARASAAWELYEHLRRDDLREAIQGVREWAGAHGAAYAAFIRPEDEDSSYLSAWPVFYNAAGAEIVDLDAMDHDEDPQPKRWATADRGYASLKELTPFDLAPEVVEDELLRAVVERTGHIYMFPVITSAGTARAEGDAA